MANIGIDLGTTNSLVAVYKDEQVIMIPNSFGDKLTPSIVGLDDSGEVIVGKIAKERLISHPGQTVSIFKPFMGSGKLFMIDDKSFTVEELSALVLRSLKQDAETYLKGDPVENCVISVPAYFTNTQRHSVKNAAEIAGLKVERIISEPTAAALAFGINQVGYDTQFIVLDLGGGTFDVSLMEYFEGIFNIKASAGDGKLGGDDFLDRIVDSFIKMYGLERTGMSPQDYQAVRSQCETIKRLLSDNDIVNKAIKIKDKEYNFGISNETFLSLSEDLITKIKDPIIRVLKDTKTRIHEIYQVVMVGGSSRMKIFSDLIKEYFPHSDIITHNPDEAIARGATIQSEMMTGGSSVEEYVVTDVTPFTLGIDVNSSALGKTVYMPIIERNSPVPITRKKSVYKSTIDQTSVAIDIFQGESINPENNVKLGRIEIPTPWRSKDKPIDVQFTYDDNGIIHVDVYVKDEGIHKSVVIKNKNVILTEAEIEAQKERIKELKILPADKVENRLIIAKLERLYEEFIGPGRDEVYRHLSEFHTALNDGDKMTIHKARLKTEDYLSQFNFNES